MKSKPSALLPSSLETWGVAFCAFIVVLLGNAHDLLQRYGLVSSSRVVHDQLGKGISQGLRRLDQYSITQNATTFIVWGLVGLIAFSVVQAIWQASQRLQYQQAVSSNEYIHPQNFNRQSYWRSIVTDLVLSFVFLALFFTSAVVYVVIAFPFASHHVGRFLLRFSVSNIGSFLLGLAAAFVSTYVLYTTWKLVVRHHRASKQ